MWVIYDRNDVRILFYTIFNYRENSGAFVHTIFETFKLWTYGFIDIDTFEKLTRHRKVYMQINCE